MVWQDDAVTVPLAQLLPVRRLRQKTALVKQFGERTVAATECCDIADGPSDEPFGEDPLGNLGTDI